jgi:hypothetical protein
MFVIKYVNQTAIFYQMGDLQIWDISCDVWEYSNERFTTGNPEIDSIEELYSVANVTDENVFEAAMLDVFATNKEFQEEGSGILDWSNVDPFSEGNV